MPREGKERGGFLLLVVLFLWGRRGAAEKHRCEYVMVMKCGWMWKVAQLGLISAGFKSSNSWVWMSVDEVHTLPWVWYPLASNHQAHARCQCTTLCTQCAPLRSQRVWMDLAAPQMSLYLILITWKNNTYSHHTHTNAHRMHVWANAASGHCVSSPVYAKQHTSQSHHIFAFHKHTRCNCAHVTTASR
jgi:hypothetical protein